MRWYINGGAIDRTIELSIPVGDALSTWLTGNLVEFMVLVAECLERNTLIRKEVSSSSIICLYRYGSPAAFSMRQLPKLIGDWMSFHGI
jgi:hypothetical protein